MLADDVLAALRTRTDAPHDPEKFLQWCGQSDPNAPPTMSRFLFALWRARPDLQDAFRGIYFDTTAQQAFNNWAYQFAVEETGAPRQLVPSSVSDGVSDHLRVTRKQRGVGVLGFLRATLGLGEAARRLVELLRMAGEPITTYVYDHTFSPLLDEFVSIYDVAAPDIVISVLPPNYLQHVEAILGNSITGGSHRIALCFWESAVVSSFYRSVFAGHDEIWVTSEFTKAALESVIQPPIPIYVFPIGIARPDIAVPSSRAAWSGRLGVGEATVVVGQVFDYASRIERKNG
jgi:hypothetical protein